LVWFASGLAAVGYTVLFVKLRLSLRWHYARGNLLRGSGLMATMGQSCCSFKSNGLCKVAAAMRVRARPKAANGPDSPAKSPDLHMDKSTSYNGSISASSTR